MTKSEPALSVIGELRREELSLHFRLLTKCSPYMFLFGLECTIKKLEAPRGDQVFEAQALEWRRKITELQGRVLGMPSVRGHAGPATTAAQPIEKVIEQLRSTSARMHAELLVKRRDYMVLWMLQGLIALLEARPDDVAVEDHARERLQHLIAPSAGGRRHDTWSETADQDA